MQTSLKPITWQLLLPLSVVAAVIGILNYYDRESLMIATNVMNLVIVIPFVALSLMLVARNGASGNLGKAWICFTVFAVLWTAGEIIWAADEIIFKNDPFPSLADLFWILGYPFYFVFAIMYLKLFRNSISKKTILLATSVSMTLMGFLVYCAIAKSESPQFETAILASYSVGDALCLIPTIIGFVLFFRGQVNFTWLLLLVGMFSFVIADSAFQIISQTGEYYTGHPFDVAYLWAYVFFVFGIYHHNRIFRTRNAQNKFNDQEKLR